MVQTTNENTESYVQSKAVVSISTVFYSIWVQEAASWKYSVFTINLAPG